MRDRNGLHASTRAGLNRRQLLQTTAVGAGALALGGLGFSGKALAAGEVNFWASATLDIEDGWKIFAEQSGVDVLFTDNGNDPGPVVARLAAGNANDIYDVGGLQGGSEKELAKQGLIAPWDLSKIPNYETVWQWAKDIPYLTYEGKVYGIPAVINANSMIALKDKVGTVDSYGVIFDPKLKGKTAMEDAWINSAIFTAMYLKESENAPIAEPGNLTPDELGLVMEFLIKHKKDGQFRTFWSGWEQGVQLVANEEVWVMTGWEPIVYAARERGIDAYYAAPKEGYEGWGNNTDPLEGRRRPRPLRRRPHLRQRDARRLLRLHARRDARLCRADRQQRCLCREEPGGLRPGQGQGARRHVKAKFAGKVYWQNTRPDNFQLYEEWWQKLRNA